MLGIPRILDLPEKLLPLIEEFNEYRYWLLEGGRGGGKSQGVARWLCYLAEKKELRVVCGRETQNSIEESVYTIFKDLIKTFELNFEVYSTKIIHRTSGSQITFKGFREQGSVNIKGLEGVDILWIDEAQSVTKNTLDIILPTIRKEDAKVYFTMNRHLKNDAVYMEFQAREDCKHIKVNYTDNPFCSEALKKEASLCSAEDYGHIWLGEPLLEADNYLFPEAKLDLCKKVDFLGCGYGETVMGVDVARYGEDKCVAVVLQQRGPLKWQLKHIERWNKTDLMATTGRIIDLMGRFKPKSVSIDGDGMGAGVIDRMAELKLYVSEFRGGITEGIIDAKHYPNLKTEWYCKLEELISMGNLGMDDARLFKMLQLIMYTHKSNGMKMILSKEMLRSKGFPSPDDADALMMAYHASNSLDRDIMDNEDYRSPQKIKKQEFNLFKLAGYR